MDDLGLFEELTLRFRFFGNFFFHLILVKVFFLKIVNVNHYSCDDVCPLEESKEPYSYLFVNALMGESLAASPRLSCHR